MEDGELTDSPVGSPGAVAGLPRHLLDTPATVLYCHSSLQCGLLQVDGLRQGRQLCFFLASDVLLATELRPGQRLHEWLRQGARLKINAKLIRERARVPFLVTTAWAESEDSKVTEEMAGKVRESIIGGCYLAFLINNVLGPYNILN